MVRTHAKAIDDVPPQGAFARRNAAHEAAKQEAKEAQQRKRDAATALETSGPRSGKPCETLSPKMIFPRP